MRCALVFYFVATIFVVVYSLPELCKVEGFWEKRALCGTDEITHTLDFIPPISQNISYIELDGQPLKQLPYNAFRNVSSQSSISHMWLKYCQISHVDAGALLNLHNLNHIQLSHNDINQIDSKLFSDTKRIKYIYLQHNKIEVVPRGLFQNLTQLIEVHLQHNQIHLVERYSFENTPSLWNIHLDNNRLEFMDILFKYKSDNLATLRLNGNPWKCNCELGPLYEFLVRINKLYQHGLECENPPTSHGKHWTKLRDEIVCPSEVSTSTQDSVMTSTEPTTTEEADDTTPVTVYNVTISTQDSVMTSTDPTTTTEVGDTIPVTVHNETRYQPVDNDIPPKPSTQNWSPYTISVLVVVSIGPVMIGVVFVVRRTPTIVKRRSDRRTNALNMDSGLPMRVVQSSAVSGDNDSGSNMADVDEEQTSIHHCEIRETTTN